MMTNRAAVRVCVQHGIESAGSRTSRIEGPDVFVTWRGDLAP